MATRGRAGRRAYWQRQVEAHRRSGLSQAAFCAEQGLRTGTLSFWKWKLGRETRAVARVEATRARRIADRASFIPIRVAAVHADPAGAAPAATDDDIDVELLVGAHRLRMRGRIDAGWLVQVLRGLTGPAC